MHAYLLFHSLVEIGAATVCFGTFLFAWNTRRYQNGFFQVLGTAAPFVGLFEVLHCLAFPGMSVFASFDANLSPQLWLAARLLEASGLLLGLALVDRRLDPRWLLAGWSAASALALGAVLGGAAPPMVRAAGLTPLKVALEWVIAACFVAALPLLWRLRSRFSPRVLRLLIANAAVMAATDLCFTLYSHPDDLVNLTGHLLLLAGVSLQYQAILRVGLIDPGEAHFRQLEEADRRKSEFLAVLSHELRNPLASIGNGLAVLERAPGDGEQARHARQVIERQARQLARLVDDLLDLTRIGQGKIRLQRERLDLVELVRRTAEDHAAPLAGAGVRFVVELARGPLWIEGDPARLTQVIGNLLGNAAKFTPAGGLVRLQLWHRDGAAALRVVDTGVGIAPDLLPQLFTPFMQAAQTLDRSRGGLGLGLALVRSLVELHGGSVRASSPGPGAGATFEVSLPVALAAPPAAEPDVRPAAPAGVARRSVLVIEDNPDAGDTLCDLLALMGHDAHLARTGAAGLEAALRLRPQVVLCDVGLPDLDGYQVARRLRAEATGWSGLLVALTGYASAQDSQYAREAGFDRHLPKPLDLEELTSLLAGEPRAA